VHDWHDGDQHAFACRIDGDAALMIVFNPEPLAAAFTLPAGRWALCLDSSGQMSPGPAPARLSPVSVPAHSLVVLKSLESSNRSELKTVPSLPQTPPPPPPHAT